MMHGQKNSIFYGQSTDNPTNLFRIYSKVVVAGGLLYTKPASTWNLESYIWLYFNLFNRSASNCRPPSPQQVFIGSDNIFDTRRRSCIEILIFPRKLLSSSSHMRFPK